MKGFKDSSKTVWLSGGYAKGGRVNGAAKAAKVMREFKSGELHSGSKAGPKVTSRKQATAIAMSEAGKTPVKKGVGGAVLGGLLGGVAGLALSQILKKQQSGEPLTPEEQQKLSSAAPSAATQPMRKGGAVRKAAGGPVGKLAAKRSMHREQEARTDAIVARGNRVAAEEQPSEALVMRRRGPNTPLIQSSAPPRSLLERKACGGLAAMPRKQGR